MEIVNNKIIKITEKELFDYWLNRFDEIYTYWEFKEAIQRKGIIIIKD